MENADLSIGKEIKRFSPATVAVENVAGMASVKVRWILRGNPKTYSIEINSAKEGLKTGSIQVMFI